MNIDNNLRHLLENETKIHLAEIRFLYQKLDRQLGLNGAMVPITFGFDTDRLGAYSPKAAPEGEGFHFSLLFIGYCVAKPLSKDDRMDLYKHEYAHYMQYNMDIPDKYNWQPGIHGSAWKYCCSLIKAAPTPYYKAGEGLINHDYDKVLKKKITDKSIPIRDAYSREQEYRKKEKQYCKNLMSMTLLIIQSSARAPLNISSSSKAQFGCMSDSVKILRKLIRNGCFRQV